MYHVINIISFLVHLMIAAFASLLGLYILTGEGIISQLTGLWSIAISIVLVGLSFSIFFKKNIKIHMALFMTTLTGIIVWPGAMDGTELFWVIYFIGYIFFFITYFFLNRNSVQSQGSKKII